MLDLNSICTSLAKAFPCASQQAVVLSAHYLIWQMFVALFLQKFSSTHQHSLVDVLIHRLATRGLPIITNEFIQFHTNSTTCGLLRSRHRTTCCNVCLDIVSCEVVKLHFRGFAK